MQEAEASANSEAMQRRSALAATAERPPVPKLSICIMVAGTRGDVQPFIALGLGLQVSNAACRICMLEVHPFCCPRMRQNLATAAI